MRPKFRRIRRRKGVQAREHPFWPSAFELLAFGLRAGARAADAADRRGIRLGPWRTLRRGCRTAKRLASKQAGGIPGVHGLFRDCPFERLQKGRHTVLATDWPRLEWRRRRQGPWTETSCSLSPPTSETMEGLPRAFPTRAEH